VETPLFWQMVVQITLIALNAVFACAEIAVISVNDNKIAKLAEQGNKQAVRLARLTSQPARFLATIQVAITFAGFLGSAFAADRFSDLLVDFFVGLGLRAPGETLDTISVVLITIILAYFTLVFGELVPKRVAMKNAESIALGLSMVVSFIAKLFAPVVWLLTKSTNLILWMLKIDPHVDLYEVSEEEIRIMVDVGSEKGVIDHEKKMIIENVFEFDDITVGEFCTHRTEVALLWLDESVEEWDKTIHTTRHMFYPVCDKTVDNVVGVLNTKDYFRLEDKTFDNIMKTAVKPAYFVPENVRADLLFRRMKQTRNHFAIVLDEYGGMYGIVTMNDLLEQLVGDLEDNEESVNNSEEITRLDDKTWEIPGCALLDDVAKQLDVSLPPGEYDTFGGLIFGSLGFIPDDGSEFEIDIENLHIKVVEIKDHRIQKALVTLNPPDAVPTSQ